MIHPNKSRNNRSATARQKTNQKIHQPSRRRFLRHSAHAGIASATLFSGLAQLGAITSASAQTVTGDYKALVCVLLAGGADSFNMLVPTDNSGYQQYSMVRADLALPQNSLLPLSNAQSGGKTLGVHAALPEMQSLYNSGKLAFLSNVGTLIEPTSTAQLASGSARLPLGLYSHADQISQWQTSVPDSRSPTGWGGRMADLLRDLNSNNRLSMSVSLSGTNTFQSGAATSEYSISSQGNGTVSVTGYRQEGAFSQLRTTAIDSIYAQQYSNLFRRAYTDTFNTSVAANEEFAGAIAQVPAFTTTFATDSFSQNMQMVARTIAARQTLGMQRQTFFVNYGGWDHHDEVLTAQGRMLPALSKGLASFQQAMEELGLDRNVTSFTTSDFGRTLTSNGRGSDHGWGGNHMIMGGAVRGGQIYGEYPDLSLNNPLDTGRGVLLPTTSVDTYFADLALWFGVDPGRLADVLPNITRFYDPAAGVAPLGMLG